MVQLPIRITLAKLYQTFKIKAYKISPGTIWLKNCSDVQFSTHERFVIGTFSKCRKKWKKKSFYKEEKFLLVSMLVVIYVYWITVLIWMSLNNILSIWFHKMDGQTFTISPLCAPLKILTGHLYLVNTIDISG